LDKDQERFRIDDSFLGMGWRTISVAFHLHPTVAAEVLRDGVLLRRGPDVWRFSGDGGGQWRVDETLIYTAYASGRGSLRLTYAGSIDLPVTLSFLLKREHR
jgi:hypothetical protein